MTTTAEAAVVVPVRAGRAWPVLLLALPAFVAIWSGWVGLGTLTGFGVVQPLPGIWDGLRIDSRVTLPIGMEAYAAYALRVWLAQTATDRAQVFARNSAVGALVLGAAGQVAYHLMSAAGVTRAPWLVTALVACLPVAVLGMGAALAHLTHAVDPTAMSSTPAAATPAGPVLLQATSAEPGARPVLVQPVDRKSAPGEETGFRVRGLAAQHPDWTRAHLGEAAGCSARTVRRHLNTTATDSTEGMETVGAVEVSQEREAS